MVADKFLTTTDTLDIDVIEVTILRGTGETLGAAGESENRIFIHRFYRDFPGLVFTHGTGRHEHDDNEKDHYCGNHTERAAVGRVEFHFIVY